MWSSSYTSHPLGSTPTGPHLQVPHVRRGCLPPQSPPACFSTRVDWSCTVPQRRELWRQLELWTDHPQPDDRDDGPWSHTINLWSWRYTIQLTDHVTSSGGVWSPEKGWYAKRHCSWWHLPDIWGLWTRPTWTNKCTSSNNRRPHTK